MRNALQANSAIQKSLTGIPGLDAMTGGGFPTGRTTVIEGGPGAGKTVLSLQTLMYGCREKNEPGLFVTCEENPDHVHTNIAGFDWEQAGRETDLPTVLDARPGYQTVVSGDLDLSGLLAAVDARVRSTGAKRIVFDSLDILLSLIQDPQTIQREVRRLYEWLGERKLTTIITVKGPNPTAPSLDFLPFLVDCHVRLDSRLVEDCFQRGLHITKYRGSAYSENRTPFLIGPGGIEVAHPESFGKPKAPASDERISSGIPALDQMLGGGYLRRSGILVSGAPGTAKTTLAGAFAQECCARGETTMFVSFDTRQDELIRNLRSVKIDLEEFVSNGLLTVQSPHTYEGSAEFQFMRIRREVEHCQARNLVIDPLSALARAGLPHSTVERLVVWAKNLDLTILCTSLLDSSTPSAEATPVEISTLADTWLHLSYYVQGGERNRGLSVVKSRGTAHSGQVRELLLSTDGISMAEVYTAGGEVLMGTLRHEKEQEELWNHKLEQARNEQRRLELELEANELEAQIAALNRELGLKQVQRAELDTFRSEQKQDWSKAKASIRELRGGSHRDERD